MIDYDAVEMRTKVCLLCGKQDDAAFDVETYCSTAFHCAELAANRLGADEKSLKRAVARGLLGSMRELEDYERSVVSKAVLRELSDGGEVRAQLSD